MEECAEVTDDFAEGQEEIEQLDVKDQLEVQVDSCGHLQIFFNIPNWGCVVEGLVAEKDKYCLIEITAKTSKILPARLISSALVVSKSWVAS